MADAASLANLTFLVSALQGVSQVASGVIAQGQAKKNAKVLRALGLAEAEEARLTGRRLAARQRAAGAAAGGDITAGSFADILTETAVFTEATALRKALARESEADAVKQAGNRALFAGILGGAGTILSSFPQATPKTPAPKAGDFDTIFGISL